MAVVPLKLDTLPRHLLAFLAHLLALARTEAVEKILEVPITLVAPVKLTPQALHPARTPTQYFVAGRVGEVHVQARQPLFEQSIADAVDQLTRRLRVTQQARAADR